MCPASCEKKMAGCNRVRSTQPVTDRRGCIQRVPGEYLGTNEYNLVLEHQQTEPWIGLRISDGFLGSLVRTILPHLLRTDLDYHPQPISIASPCKVGGHRPTPLHLTPYTLRSHNPFYLPLPTTLRAAVLSSTHLHLGLPLVLLLHNTRATASVGPKIDRGVKPVRRWSPRRHRPWVYGVPVIGPTQLPTHSTHHTRPSVHGILERASLPICVRVYPSLALGFSDVTSKQ